MKNYFLNYDETAKVNYGFIFALYRIAEINPAERIENLIVYKSQRELAERLKQVGFTVSPSTINRILNDEKYLPYFSKSETENKLLLHNNFKKGKANSNKFVILTEKETTFLMEQNNTMLYKYYLYLKYYCGYSKSKTIDTTANQILSAIGYSANCGNNKDSLCKFNSLLLEKGFISIKKIKDSKGYCRNIYSMNL